jgi:hypothetical protein
MKFPFHHSVNFIHHNKLTWVILHIKQCRLDLKNEWISNSIWMDDFPNLVARLEIISDVVSERHVAEKFRYHIGNTDTTSVFSDTTSEIPKWYRKKPMWYRYFPMWYRYFRCGIGISDVVSEYFRYVPFPIPHRKLFLTVYIIESFNFCKR